LIFCFLVSSYFLNSKDSTSICVCRFTYFRNAVGRTIRSASSSWCDMQYYLRVSGTLLFVWYLQCLCCVFLLLCCCVGAYCLLALIVVSCFVGVYWHSLSRWTGKHWNDTACEILMPPEFFLGLPIPEKKSFLNLVIPTTQNTVVLLLYLPVSKWFIIPSMVFGVIPHQGSSNQY
jgi:hypothetical protein